MWRVNRRLNVGANPTTVANLPMKKFNLEQFEAMQEASNKTKEERIAKLDPQTQDNVRFVERFVAEALERKIPLTLYANGKSLGGKGEDFCVPYSTTGGLAIKGEEGADIEASKLWGLMHVDSIKAIATLYEPRLITLEDAMGAMNALLRASLGWYPSLFSKEFFQKEDKNDADS